MEFVRWLFTDTRSVGHANFRVGCLGNIKFGLYLPEWFDVNSYNIRVGN